MKEALAVKHVSADFYDEFNDEVEELLAYAARRVETNDRKTARPRDI